MKVCPQCNQEYNDETLNFCLTDGAMLVVKQNQPPPTVFINQPPITSSNIGQTSGGKQQHWSVAPIQTPKKSSKTWIWVLGIIGFIGVIGLAGIIGLVALFASFANNSSDRSDYNGVFDKTKSSNTDSDSDSGKYRLKDDFSTWEFKDPNYGTTEVKGNELWMTSKNYDYYFVLSTANKDFRTENATTKVTVRNTTNKTSRSGYGIVIHSDEDTPLKKDYAFLIDSNTQNYRICKHAEQKESDLVGWTRSTVINRGTAENVLEVKAEDDSMTFYINGKLIKTVKDKVGNKKGIVGIYSSGGFPIAFSNLQISK